MKRTPGMQTEQRQKQEQKQQLAMTPKMQMAIEVLQMNTVELSDFIQKKLEENPLLEKEDNYEERGKLAINAGNYSSPVNEGEREKFKKFIAYQPGMLEHVENQLVEYLPRSEIKTGKAILRSLDSSGLLTAGCEEIAAELDIEVEKVEKVREKIMRMEPAGLAAVSPREALEVQLEGMGEVGSRAVKLLKESYENLEGWSLEELCSHLGAEKEEVLEVLDRLKKLHPHPAEGYSSGRGDVKYLEPDIIVKKTAQNHEIEFNDRASPVLNVDRDYYQRLKGYDEETAAFLDDKLQSAFWLIKAIEQRRITIERITESIVSHQRDFLKKGMRYLKPLTMREIAEEIDVHVSTVSRAVKSKLIQTDRGLYELKFFFARGVKGTATPVIKLLVTSHIREEDKSCPLSDREIAERLERDEGIEISRRTVAKYRKSLGIPSSSRRKNWQHSHRC